ncbi:hypothetical protein C8F01DRAFT_1318187 [Mycena amicta]|nr:hypothetical protein C8F01DRAFT_1318187 [Mycena amicta]
MWVLAWSQRTATLDPGSMHDPHPHNLYTLNASAHPPPLKQASESMHSPPTTHCWSPTPSPHPGSSHSRSRHPLYELPNSCPSAPYSDELSGFGAHNYLRHSAGHWDAGASDPRTCITWLESPLEPQACSSFPTEPIPSDFLFAADSSSDICVFDGNTDDLSIGVDDHLHQLELSSFESKFTTEATDWPGWDPTGASMANMYYLAEFFSNASAADVLGIPTRTASDSDSFGSGTHWAQSASSLPELTSLVDDTPPSILSSSVPDKSSPWEPVAAIKCSNCPALRSETRHIYHQFSKTALCSACYTFQLKSKGTEPRPVYLELKRAVRRAKKASAVAKLKKKDCSHCASSLVPVVRKPHRPCKGN